MNRKRFDDIKGLIRAIEGIAELLLLSIVYYYFIHSIYEQSIFVNFSKNIQIVITITYSVLVFALFKTNDSFLFGHLRLSHVLISQAIAICIANFVAYFELCLTADRFVSLVPIIFMTVIDLLVIFLLCYSYTVLYHRIHTPRNMLLIYGNSDSINLKKKIETRPDKYHVTNMLSIEEGRDKLIEAIKAHDAVIINDVSAEERNDVLKYCYDNSVRTYIVPKISDIINRGAKEINLFDTPILLIKGTGLSGYQRFVKRTMDVLLCLIALIPAAPIMLITALAIKLEDHGPVFYKQERVTKDMKRFNILKFRSMIVDAEKDGISIPATDKDPRITKVGNIIRPFRIDELPQILNILKGDMSIVGPRPERVEHVEKYLKEIPEFSFRYKIKGGLTGYAQIYGRYNTTPYDKLRLDLMYIENYSLL